ncbi:hypothetical protein D3C73_1077080 [compost metagenome]
MRVLHHGGHRHIVGVVSGTAVIFSYSRCLVIQLQNAYFMRPVGIILLEQIQRPGVQIAILANGFKRFVIGIENFIVFGTRGFRNPRIILRLISCLIFFHQFILHQLTGSIPGHVCGPGVQIPFSAHFRGERFRRRVQQIGFVVSHRELNILERAWIQLLGRLFRSQGITLKGCVMILCLGSERVFAAAAPHVVNQPH